MTLRSNCVTFAAGLALMIASGAALAADGNAENGKKLFFSTAQCKVCHSIKKDVKLVGPSLFDVYGRKCGTAAKQVFSSNYRAACAKTGWSWDDKGLNAYLEDPSAYISGLSGKQMRSPMTRQTPKPQDRADIIAFLKTLK
jgi:cytochrome c